LPIAKDTWALMKPNYTQTARPPPYRGTALPGCLVYLTLRPPGLGFCFWKITPGGKFGKSLAKFTWLI